MTEQDLIQWFASRRRARVLSDAIFASDPGAGGYALPIGFSVTCATTGRTSQTSASTLRTGLGANNARGRNVGGSWGLGIERAATIVNPHSDTNSMTVWFEGTQTTVLSIAGPSGTPNEATRVGQINHAVNVTGVIYDLVAEPAFPWLHSKSCWVANSQTGAPSGGIATSPYSGNSEIHIAFPVTAWNRVDIAYTSAEALVELDLFPVESANFDGTLDFAYPQLEAGAYPTSVFPHVAANAVRAADVLSFTSPTTYCPGGFFDLTLVFAPHHTHAEQAVDRNLFYIGANDRCFLRASDHKIVLRIGGVDIASSALMWSREQQCYIRLQHTPTQRLIEVLGATTGNGVTSGSAAAAITLPGTAYLMGSDTGAEEGASLMGWQFQRPI